MGFLYWILLYATFKSFRFYQCWTLLLQESDEGLLKHMTTAHGGEKATPVQCPWCGGRFGKIWSHISNMHPAGHISMLCSHCSSSNITVLSLVESFIVMLRQLSYAIKNQLKAPKAPLYCIFDTAPKIIYYREQSLAITLTFTTSILIY